MPERLAELYHALGDDPFLIEETVGRSALVSRLMQRFLTTEERLTGKAARAEPHMGNYAPYFSAWAFADPWNDWHSRAPAFHFCVIYIPLGCVAGDCGASFAETAGKLSAPGIGRQRLLANCFRTRKFASDIYSVRRRLSIHAKQSGDGGRHNSRRRNRRSVVGSREVSFRLEFELLQL